MAHLKPPYSHISTKKTPGSSFFYDLIVWMIPEGNQAGNVSGFDLLPVQSGYNNYETKQCS
jgi:hypothetical protein